MNEILKKIDEAKHITVVAHVNPDADSFGSASAMYTYLLTLHKKVSFFCATKEINQKLSFLPWFDKVRDSFPFSCDLAIVFDCSSEDRIGTKIECDMINIDHHKTNTRFAKFSLVDSSCISTTEVLYNLFTNNDIKVNKKMATALYAGVLEDSNGLLSDEVNGTTFALIGELISCGADYKSCNRFVMKYLSLGAFRIKGIMQTNMRLYSEAKIAVFCVTNDDIQKSGAVISDCEYALEESLYLPTVEIALLLVENYDFTIKGSLRSKNGFDVSLIAMEFGGGGHISRAGFNIKENKNLESLKTEIIELINKEI